MVPRMRTIDECYKHIKTLDPDSKLTKTAIRGMVNNDEIPVVWVGNKVLINLDIFEQCLINGIMKKPALENANYGSIRKITE